MLSRLFLGVYLHGGDRPSAVIGGVSCWRRKILSDTGLAGVKTLSEAVSNIRGGRSGCRGGSGSGRRMGASRGRGASSRSGGSNSGSNGAGRSGGGRTSRGISTTSVLGGVSAGIEPEFAHRGGVGGIGESGKWWLLLMMVMMIRTSCCWLIRQHTARRLLDTWWRPP